MHESGLLSPKVGILDYGLMRASGGGYAGVTHVTRKCVERVTNTLTHPRLETKESSSTDIAIIMPNEHVCDLCIQGFNPSRTSIRQMDLRDLGRRERESNTNTMDFQS